MPQTVYGSWKSPITSDLIVQGTIKLEQVTLDGANTYWIENRPAESGRNVIVKNSANNYTEDVIAAPFNARSRVHEYGGGSYLVAADVTYFSNFSNGCIYRQRPQGTPEALTTGKLHYADGIADLQRQRLIWVAEDHGTNGNEPSNYLLSVSLIDTSKQVIIHSGQDFYCCPRLSPDGSQLAWVSWNHPNMPWDATQLWLADIATDGSLHEARCVAGADNSESITQPEWSPDGVLYFVSDRNNWWNIYRYANSQIEPLVEKSAEFARPHWVFGQSCYAFASAQRIICTYNQNGLWQLAEIDLTSRTLTDISTPFTDISYLRASANEAVFCGGSATIANAVVKLDLTTHQYEILKSSSSVAIDANYISVPEPIEFPTTAGRTAFGFYYAPRNPQHQAPPGELPPLFVKSHGGPTSAASSIFNLQIQYWTSRGIGVLDVNYGGSTGFGRQYRQRLNDNWGIIDVDDCCHGAEYLVAQGKADPNRLIISGGSAGGYTTLCALTFKNVFKAGASYYGISDLEALAQDTHKFESRYEDRLVGPYPERKDLYQARSPINFQKQLSCPMIFFQGAEDKVVPPNQSEMMVNALRDKKLPVAYLLFAGEQHGFRQAATIKRALDAELYFYSRIFQFDLADQVEPIEIENL